MCIFQSEGLIYNEEIKKIVNLKKGNRNPEKVTKQGEAVYI